MCKKNFVHFLNKHAKLLSLLYRNLIMKQNKKNLTPKRRPKRRSKSKILKKSPVNVGFVYAAYSPDLQWVKIGYTRAENTAHRIRQLNTAVVTPYVLISTMRCDNPKRLESFIHRYLAPVRLNHILKSSENFDISVSSVRVLFDAVRVKIDIHGRVNYRSKILPDHILGELQPFLKKKKKKCPLRSRTRTRRSAVSRKK